jgi:acyl carrier protein
MDRAVERTEALLPGEISAGGEVYEEPQGELEAAVAEVWKETFKLDRISRNDNFFGLGGNSLLGMQLTEKLADKMNLQIPVVVLFQYPSVRELAEVISAAETEF